MEQMIKQPTTKEHVEIFLDFLFRFFLFSGVVKLVGAICNSASRLDSTMISILQFKQIKINKNERRNTVIMTGS